ncbi:pentatricopeptide repeat-containing protein At3g57430, chloroplastic-like [Selaginella moellendorffii]|uniref:pentatricopeptide repeat-containing protein At3g57430, chloroplastic-like n=1 Tax=Selaginella moellendorffii TaxID=88036 RepID=UPI000D1D05F4|nr:pentatricopeptide repeat-containing protein At3g57430, chloroplastic-like [Selaginella moellendorffii]|eukprot:XP_024519268.1 pentatricopeptide repeat-containing protein At3g57430, chloroplastic-like [Selaginella moellendorffii]
MDGGDLFDLTAENSTRALGMLEECSVRAPGIPCKDTAARPGAYLAALKVCGGARDLERGRRIHSEIIRASTPDCFVSTALVDMYCKCGSLVEARAVFEGIPAPERSVVSWNCIVMGYAQCARGDLALDLYARMDCAPNRVTFLALLKACVSLSQREDPKLVAGAMIKPESLRLGRWIHSRAARTGDDRHLQVSNTIIDMYSKLGCSIDAHRLLDAMPRPSVVSWNCLLLGYAENGRESFALELFSRMEDEGYDPDTVTFVAALKACASLADRSTTKLRLLEKGRSIHSRALRAFHGKELHIFLSSTLVDMYAKCGSLDEACRVFKSMRHRSVVTWNCIITAYAQSGHGELALQHFQKMVDEGGLEPDAITLMAALKACGSIAEREEPQIVEGKLVKPVSLERGRALHRRVASSGSQHHSFVASSLLDMYSKCGSMEDAREIFERMESKDLVCWTSMILGYAESGQGELALKLYTEMKASGLEADDVTFVAALKACGSLGALAAGKNVEAEICNAGVESHLVVANALVDFYGKCGSMAEAREIFESLSSSRRVDVITWNSLIDGYSRQGSHQQVFDLLDEMVAQNFRPNEITMLSALAVCSHSGLVDRGREFLETMEAKFRVSPGVKHYSCVVGLLGRANRFDEALKVVRSMPCDPGSSLWLTLLGASWKWNDLSVGELAFDKLREENSAAAFVLMSNIYANGSLPRRTHEHSS